MRLKNVGKDGDSALQTTSAGKVWVWWEEQDKGDIGKVTIHAPKQDPLTHRYALFTLHAVWGPLIGCV